VSFEGRKCLQIQHMQQPESLGLCRAAREGDEEVTSRDYMETVFLLRLHDSLIWKKEIQREIVHRRSLYFVGTMNEISSGLWPTELNVRDLDKGRKKSLEVYGKDTTSRKLIRPDVWKVVYLRFL
jgi:hypothetical protein